MKTFLDIEEFFKDANYSGCICIVYSDENLLEYFIDKIKTLDVIAKYIKLPKEYIYFEDSIKDLKIDEEYRYYLGIGNIEIYNLLDNASNIFNFKYDLIYNDYDFLKNRSFSRVLYIQNKEKKYKLYINLLSYSISLINALYLAYDKCDLDLLNKLLDVDNIDFKLFIEIQNNIADKGDILDVYINIYRDKYPLINIHDLKLCIVIVILRMLKSVFSSNLRMYIPKDVLASVNILTKEGIIEDSIKQIKLLKDYHVNLSIITRFKAKKKTLYDLIEKINESIDSYLFYIVDLKDSFDSIDIAFVKNIITNYPLVDKKKSIIEDLYKIGLI